MSESDNDCIVLHEQLAFFAPLVARESKRLRRQLGRAQMKGLPADLTLAQWLRILATYRWSCVWCRGPYESLDHLLPLRAGGGTTATNCVPSCVSCNSSRDRFEVMAATTQKRLVSLVG